MNEKKKQNINPPFISTEIKILPGGKIFIPTKPPKPIQIDSDKEKKEGGEG